MRVMVLVFGLMVFLCSLNACSSVQIDEEVSRLTLMTYNVENLFDTEDDPLKNDNTFLPLSAKQGEAHKKRCRNIKRKVWRDQCLNWDWSEEMLKVKLERLNNVVQSVKSGRGPDVLFLQEVENLKVLRQWNQMALNYPHVVLLEGKDRRGIDVALLSRLPLVGEPQLHSIPFKKISKKRKGDTRGILQVDLKLPKVDKKSSSQTLTAFVVHFPAPFHPAKYRQQALQFLNRLKKKLPKNRLVVAAGDFNIPSEEDKSRRFTDRLMEPHWLLAHRLGCSGCRGTNYYPPKKSWSFLDMILLSKNFRQRPWLVDNRSVRLVNQIAEQKTEEGHPQRFALPQGTGVSDHWPLAVDIIKYKEE